VQEAKHFRQVGYRGPITVIPNGVDTDEFTSGDRSEAEAYWPELKERPVVLFMSRLSREKGLDQLIPAWADLVKSAAYKDTILVIAGPDDRGYRKIVEGIIDRYNVGSQVCMTGMVQGRRKLALLRRADIFVLPSYSENFGIVVVEALACGTPVITTTGTPWQELQEVDAGRWVLPREAELARALRELLNMSQSERMSMGQRGQNLIQENYAWDRIVKKFLTVYDCILSGKSIPLYPEPNIE
jgi:glycosyltransferase involved in cell wall biosynthesis